MTKKNRIKCTKDCLIVFWLSVFAMFLMSAIDGSTSNPPELIPSESIIFYTFSQGDTMVYEDTIVKAQPIKKLNTQEKKEQEYQIWKQRGEQLDEDMMRMEAQSIMMDSLLGKTDTIKIVR